MRTCLKHLIVISIFIGVFSSCKTFREVENLRPKSPEEQRVGEIQRSQLTKLKKADFLRNTKKGGVLVYIKFRAFEADTLYGTSERSGIMATKPVSDLKMAFSEIEELRVKRVGPALTIPVAVTGAYATAFII